MPKEAKKFPLNPFATSPTTRTRWIPQIGNELRPTFERLAQALRLVERARSEGAENLPSRTDTDLDEPQRQIVGEVQSGANLLKQFLSSQLHDGLEKIQARMPKGLDDSLALAEARAAAAKARLAHGEQLESARVIERRRFRTLRKFRRDNRLSRDAAYAQTWALPAATLLALIVAEGIGNAFLFMNGVDDGLAGGFILAALCSVVNIAIGFAAGFIGLRLITHVKTSLKVVGTIALLTTTFLGICWNFKVAHFREALEHGATAKAFLNASTFLPSPGWFTFTGMESVALLLLGLIVFLCAMLKGRGGHTSFVDHYWDFDKVDFAHRLAEGAYEQEKDQYKAAVEQAYQGARNDLRAIHSANEAAIREIREIADQAEQRAAEVRDSIGEWAATGSALLRRFREENRAVRTDPAPAYFDAYPTFDDVGLGIADPAAVRAAADAAVSIHEGNATRMAEVERTLADALHTETTGFLAEVENIEERAGQRLNRDWSDEEPVAPAADGPRVETMEAA